MQKVSSWRDLLQSLLSTPAERERVAAAIGVRSITLVRWMQGDSVPRPDNLRQLLVVLPAPFLDQFRLLLEQEGIHLSLPLEGEGIFPQEIPYSFIREVFSTRATTPDSMRFWAISRQVLQHAIRQLDSFHTGMLITVVHCMPPGDDGIIRSLRESTGRGTPPWTTGELDHQAMFLGAESLAGYAVMSGRPAFIQNLKAESLYYPASLVEHEVSAAAFPLLYANRIAGCLLFSSAQPEYFVSASRLAIVHGYTDLMTLAFAAEEFYPPEFIELRVMPPITVQQQYFNTFRQRVLKVMADSVHSAHPLPYAEAEQVAWLQLEEILLQLPPSAHEEQ
jgi:GAF domain